MNRRDVLRWLGFGGLSAVVPVVKGKPCLQGIDLAKGDVRSLAIVGYYDRDGTYTVLDQTHYRMA